MHLNPLRLLALTAGGVLSVIASPAHAADTQRLPPPPITTTPFTASDFDELTNMVLRDDGALSLNVWQGPLVSERILFPNEQRLSVTFVHGASDASHSLGYVYYDDLVARGYVNAQGDLVDANGNGIADLHEDLYNMAPPTGPQARPYIGTTRRCSPRTFVSQGVTLTQPELALNASCASAFAWQITLEDARLGEHEPYDVDVVGTAPTASTAPNANAWSDLGLYPRIPNLLEPAHAMNNQLGLGHLLFLQTDDDGDRTTFNQLGVVPDVSSLEDGIPDYDVSKYDANGIVRAVNPDPGISAYDRTVDLGSVPAGKELVFFLVTQYPPYHDVNLSWVYPCLRKAANGQCTLHLQSAIQVFFSKSKWNLDQDPVGQTPVAQRNVGCEYSETCDPYFPRAINGACTVATSTQRLCGWLNDDALTRLRSFAYGNLYLPMTAASVPATSNGITPHLLMQPAPSAPGQWLMGFEDMPGGGDRDFNDVVFLLRDAQEGYVRSRVLSQEDTSSRITQVYFNKFDTLGPGCDAKAAITYDVATDCNVCGSDFCVPNPAPTWHRLSLPPELGGTTVDVSATPGHQLCWRAQVSQGSSFGCLPTLHFVNVDFVSEPVNP